MDESASTGATGLAGPKETVVVAHGLWMTGLETLYLRRHLGRLGFDTRVFRYRSVRDDLRHNARQLARFVESVPGDTVHFLGYSLGGIVISRMLHERIPPRTGRVVCLGPPFRTSSSAAALLRLTGGRTILGANMAEIVRNGGYDSWDLDVPLGVIAGNTSLGLGRLLNRFDEPNDGTVAVSETLLAGEKDHIVLHVSHASMLFSRQVACNVAAFLQTEKFLHTPD